MYRIKQVVWGLVLTILLASPAMASDAIRRSVLTDRGPTPGVGEWQTWQVFTVEPVAGAVTVDSLAGEETSILLPNGMLIGKGGFFGVWVKLAGSTPDVTVKILQSYDDTAANYAIPETGGTVLQVTDTNAHVTYLQPSPMTRMRLRLVGGAGNGSNVTVTLYLFTHP